MNLILLNPGQIRADNTAELDDRQAMHVRAVLKAAIGQELRIGVLNGPRGTGTLTRLAGDTVELACRLEPAPPPPPCFDLLLALPRPKVLKRLWAPLAALGVRRICLTNAARVERNYFDTHWLEPGHYEPLLREGLEQAEDTLLPEVRVIRRLKPFVEDELDSLFPAEARLLAHPEGGAPAPRLALTPGRRVLLAVGPEGGWTEFELALFEQRGFARLALGPRKLRTDTACIALLGALLATLAQDQ